MKGRYIRGYKGKAKVIKKSTRQGAVVRAPDTLVMYQDLVPSTVDEILNSLSK